MVTCEKLWGLGLTDDWVRCGTPGAPDWVECPLEEPVYFSQYSPAEGYSLWDINNDGAIGYCDVKYWADNTRKYPQEYQDVFPTVMADLLKIDGISARTKYLYKSVLDLRSCNVRLFGSPDLKPGDESITNTDFETIVGIEIMARSDLNEITGRLIDSLNFYLGFAGNDAPTYRKLVEDLKEEVKKAAENELLQIRFYQAAAIEMLNLSSNGPAGIGVHLLAYDNAKKISDNADKIIASGKEGFEADVIKNGYDPRIIYDVEKNGPAERWGLKKGDVILKVGRHDTVVMSEREIAGEIIGPCSEPVKFEIMRGDERLNITVPRELPNMVADRFWAKTSTDIPSLY